jgi:hypothetical protein
VVCERTPKCPLYAQFQVKELLAFWKTQYCEAPDFERCQRYQRWKRGEEIPVNLLPSGGFLAAQ